MKLFLSFAGKSNVSISMEKLELMENTYAVFMDRKISHKFRTMDAYFKRTWRVVLIMINMLKSVGWVVGIPIEAIKKTQIRGFAYLWDDD